jgi:hypothetical protein
LNLEDDSAFSSRILVDRLVRPERRERFEHVPGFIPPCATVTAHTEIARVWKRMLETLISLADFYIELHRSIVEYLALCEGKDIDLTVDRETLDFVARMVVTVEHCIYEVLDPATPPRLFIQELYRIVRSSAVFLELSPPTRVYFEKLAEAGETEFLPLIQQQLQALRLDRRWVDQHNLKGEISQLSEAIYRLRRLAEALGGKYLDYRLSPSLEALGFVIDRDRQSLFKAISRVANTQATATESTFVFARLQLGGRERYRVILIGDPRASFVPEETIKSTIRINVGGGTTTEPIYQDAVCEIPGQRNFAIDFETREVGAITDVRVSIRSDHPIRSAMLYSRKFLFAERAVERPAPPPEPPIPQPVGPRTPMPPASPSQPQPEPDRHGPRKPTRIVGPTPPRRPNR